MFSFLTSGITLTPCTVRWDPVRTGPYSFESGLLYTSYYDLQIMVHRPFVHKQTPQALPSLVICTNAARSLSRMLEIIHDRGSSPFFVFDVNWPFVLWTLADFEYRR